MSRLRYIVDMPRGPRGGNNDVRHMYTWVESAKRALRSGTRGIQMPEPKGHVLQLDLDDLYVVGSDFDATFQWHDRRALHHTTEAMRMREAEERGGKPSTWLTTADIAMLRECADEWELENARARKTPAMLRAFFTLRDLRRDGKLGPP